MFMYNWIFLKEAILAFLNIKKNNTGIHEKFTANYIWKYVFKSQKTNKDATNP